MSYTMVFDTETTSIDKPFCYDISWVIMNMETGERVDFKSFVVEQVWHNLPLFESAYYKDKRSRYIEMMRKHETTMDKWGYIMQNMKRDIRKYNVTEVYAYNSDFDDRVITFNCDWFKCNNPLENIAIYDIWGYASQFITNESEYQNFCEEHKCFTDTGNYKGSAEVVYQYITENPDFIEEHMGLFDSEIESEILWFCVNKHEAEWATKYKAVRILPRMTARKFEIKVDGTTVYAGMYKKKNVRSDVYNFKTE